jgi:mannosyl-oligosaccharide glucosidase
VAQYPAYGNPPTLILALSGYITRLRERGISLATSIGEVTDDTPASASPAALASLHLASPSLASAYLTSVYPAFKRHYEWFRRTQKGEVRQFGRKARSASEAYRWRGRVEDYGEPNCAALRTA